MPIPKIPTESPLVGKGGFMTQPWLQFFQDLLGLPAQNQKSVNATYTADPLDTWLYCTANTFTLTFPVSQVLAGKTWQLFNSGAGTISFAASSGSVLGLTTIGPGAGATVTTDGVNLMVKN